MKSMFSEPEAKPVTLRERQRLDAQFLASLDMAEAEYNAVPDAVEREGCTLEQIEAEEREAQQASERLKQISAQCAADRDAKWRKKQELEKARRARHKGKDRSRKQQPTRRIRTIVLTEVSLEGEREKEEKKFG